MLRCVCLAVSTAWLQMHLHGGSHGPHACVQYAALYGTTAVALGLSQWSNCAVVGGSIGGNAMYPYYPELCGYALHVANPPFTLATLPPESVSVAILTSMIGSTSAQ